MENKNKITLSDGTKDVTYLVENRTYVSLLAHAKKYGEEVTEEAEIEEETEFQTSYLWEDDEDSDNDEWLDTEN